MRLIDADVMREEWLKNGENEYVYDTNAVLDSIDAQPTIDAQPVVHGCWILGDVKPGYFTPGGNRPWICSECGQVVSYMLDRPKNKYCHECGAKMDKENPDD